MSHSQILHPKPIIHMEGLCLVAQMIFHSTRKYQSFSTRFFRYTKLKHCQLQKLMRFLLMVTKLASRWCEIKFSRTEVFLALL